jgi:hypothetical protein
MWLAPKKVGAHSDTVGGGTALQAGRTRVRFTMVSLTFSFLEPTKPRTEKSNRNISWVKDDGCIWLTILSPWCALVLNSGNLNFLEPSESEQAYTGIAFYLIKSRGTRINKSVVWTACESFTISQHSSMLLIMHLRLWQGDSEFNQKWFIHFGKRYCVKRCS